MKEKPPTIKEVAGMVAIAMGISVSLPILIVIVALLSGVEVKFIW